MTINLRKFASSLNCSPVTFYSGSVTTCRSSSRTPFSSKLEAFHPISIQPHRKFIPRSVKRPSQQQSIRNTPSFKSGFSLRMTSTLAKPLGAMKLTAEPENIVDTYRRHIAERLAPILNKDASEIFPLLHWTQTLDKGDLMFPVSALRVKGKPPPEQAKDIVASFPTDDETLATASANGPFVQFFFKPAHLLKQVIPLILKSTDKYGSSPKLGLVDPKDPSKGRKKMIVEFSSPNIAKEFHAGHLRSTIIGGFLSKLYELLGFDVIRMNYLGDWGKQYGLLANGFRQFGSEQELQEQAIAHLFTVYVKISKIKAEQDVPINELKKQIREKKTKGEDTSELEKELEPLVAESEDEKARQYFKSMEDGEPEAVALWKRFRDMSIEKYKKTYARLNIAFDDYSGESQVNQKTINTVLADLMEKKIAEESEGAILIDFSKHGAKKLNKAIIQRKDGTPLYLTRDLAAILERWDKYQFDGMIYVIADQQNEHVAQLFKTTEISGHRDISARCEHISFGMVKGMSTRRGTVKFLDDIIAAVKDVMLDVMKKNQKKYDQLDDPEATADILAITAIMVQDLTGKVRNGYEFNFDAMTAFEGDTGPYLQYAHARLCSIERKAGIDLSSIETADLSLLTESHAINLARSLASYPDVIMNTMKTKEPSTLLTYLFKMSHALSSSYDVLQVVGSEPELMKARLALYEAARQVLWNGMTLLGLTPVERM